MLNIMHLGQAGFMLSTACHTVIIDPYLSYSVDDGDRWIRKYAPSVKPTELTCADIVLMSHDHLDHVDPETLLGIANASPDCKFAASAAFAVPRLSEIGIDKERIIPLESDISVSFGNITVTPIPAAHEELHPSEQGGFAELGFIINIEGKRIFHGGDTCLYDGLCRRIMGVDVGILPVNGRDEIRHKMNCIGNMNAVEAAGLAHDAKIGLVIPCHWELYELNSESPENIRDAFAEHPDVKYELMLNNMITIE